MQATISLSNVQHALSLRMQVPALNVMGHDADIQVTMVNDDIHWEGQAGHVRLTGTCAPAGEELWYIDLSVTNAGPDVEIRVAYPYLFYHIAQDQPVRAFDPTFGGVLEVFRHPLDNYYPGPASYCLLAACHAHTILPDIAAAGYLCCRLRERFALRKRQRCHEERDDPAKKGVGARIIGRIIGDRLFNTLTYSP